MNDRTPLSGPQHDHNVQGSEEHTATTPLAARRMESKARIAVESAVYRTLHAHSFSRSSSQASRVLTDLLARYFTLLSSTCARYAQHAGRINLTTHDMLCALEEMGVSMTELGEFGGSEGAEMERYILNTARRVEELRDLKANLSEGLKHDRDDAIPLVYAPLPENVLSLESVSNGDKEEEEDVVMGVDQDELQYSEADVAPNGIHHSPPRSPRENTARPSAPPLPLSPISNPSTPPRKRQRTANWKPPPHIPDFLPPFPTDEKPEEPLNLADSPRMVPAHPPPLRIETRGSPLPQPSTPAYASDYFTSVPYEQSSLSTVPEWHLPSSRPPRAVPANITRLQTPQTQQALIKAYHHILTNPPPAIAPAANPSRHKVAIALLSLMQTKPRWEPPDTLYSSSAPCSPRVAVIGPSFPIPIGAALHSSTDADAERERKANFPALPPRPLFTSERLTPLITQQSSRIPELARQVLPVSVHTRTTRLHHPPPLFRDTRRLLYGPGVNAPWNAGSSSAIVSTPTTAKMKDAANGVVNGKDSKIRVIADARLYATWDYEPKRHNEALLVGRRGRMSSMSGLTLSLSRGPNEGRNT